MTAVPGPAKTVRTPSADYDRMSRNWDLPRALMGGTQAMRRKGRVYLPQEPGESDGAYQDRLNRTTLFNAFRKTVKDMLGRIFAKPIVLGEDVPEILKDYSENIDLAGRNLDTFAFEVAKDAMQLGVSFILTEMPPALGDGATRADEIAQGRRPYLVHVKAEDLIGWKSALVNGRETISQVRIVERVGAPDPGNPFEDREVEQVRVLAPGAWTVYRKPDPDKDEWTVHDAGPTSLREVPLVPIYFNRTGFLTAEPPLQDLADLNVAHWQSASDQRNILHVARVPLLFGAGFSPDDALVVGAGTMARASDVNAKLVYVEHSGRAIGAGRDDLKDLEARMQAMGLQLLVSQPGRTATGEVRDDVKETSPLAMMAHALQDGLERAFGFMAAYEGLGEDAGGSLTVNRDFGLAANGGTDRQTLVDAARHGLLTHETFLNELKRRGVLADDLDVAGEIARLARAAATGGTDE